MRIFNLLCFSFFFGIYYSVSAQQLNPVLLIPGDGGTQIEARLNKTYKAGIFCSKVRDWFLIWLNLELFSPLKVACLVDNLRLHYDPKTHTTHNTPGVDIRVRGWGNTTTVEYLDTSKFGLTIYFSAMVDALAKVGYKRGVSVRGAPFDFRRSPNEQDDLFKELKALIEDTYTKNGGKPVVLVAHSMGCMMSLFLLRKVPGVDEAWRKKYIHSLVAISGPWAGASKSLKVMVVGENFKNFLVAPIKVRPEEQSMTSSAWLLPNSRIFKSRPLVQVVKSKGSKDVVRKWSAEEYKELFTAMNFTTGWSMREDTKDLVDDFVDKGPGVAVHCLHGTDLNTPEIIQFQSPADFPNGKYDLLTGRGDGTVNELSAAWCQKWADHLPEGQFHYKTFSGVEHVKMLRNPAVIDYLLTKVLGIHPNSTKSAKYDAFIRNGYRSDQDLKPKFFVI